MQETPRPRAQHQLPLTRNHLYAMGTLSVCLAAIAFFVGFSLGRGRATVPATAAAPGLVAPEVRTGELEVLLSKVEHASAGDAALGFPAELPRTDPPPPPVDPLAPVPVDVEPAPPPPNPFPAEPRPGGADLAAAPAVSPKPDAAVPTSGWSVEVAEHASESDAARAVETLVAADLAAYRVVALVSGKAVWRVRVGGYGSKEAATAAAPAVASKAGASATKVTPAP